MLQHRGVVDDCPVGALAHLGLARAYTLSGDTAKTRAKCQDFFALWKDADPNIPILRQAKGEYATMQYPFVAVPHHITATRQSSVRRFWRR